MNDLAALSLAFLAGALVGAWAMFVAMSRINARIIRKILLEQGYVIVDGKIRKAQV